MNNRIDQLFKEKLGEHKVAPSAEAWEKVQAGLVKKNKRVIVWRLAAVLALFGASVGAWYFNLEDGHGRTNQLTQTNEVTQPENKTNEQPKEFVVQEVKPAIAKATKKSNWKNNIPYNETTEKQVDHTNENTAVNQQLVEEQVIAEPVLITQTTKQEKPIVIEFTLETVTKPLVKEVVQNSQEENSGLKKILEAAIDMKNGDSDLGIIRDTKNQLFALDFRKDKPKRN